MQKPVIELQGVEFVNKGAELMLHAIRQKVQQQYPGAVFTMVVNQKVPAAKLKQYGIFKKKKNTLKARLLPRFVRRALGLVLDKEVQVLLDGSGFAFSDQWGLKTANRRLALKIDTLKKEGKKVILLPQAFGPFTHAGMQPAMYTILTKTDLVFAREARSYGYLKNIADVPALRLAPDFTNLIKGTLPQKYQHLANRVAIIPNSRMIDKKGAEGTFYIRFLTQAVSEVRKAGLSPFILIHEGADDIAIANQVNTLIENPLEIVIDADPLVIKGIIATLHFIICSRFHGVVSALSQGVPCLSTSWSHKYEMLHEEYDYKEGLMSNVENETELAQKVALLATPEWHTQTAKKLKANSQVQKERSAEMWNEVFKIIDAA